MKHGIGRKLLSVVLAVMMLVSLLPTAAFADDSAEPIVVNSVVGDSNTGNDTKLADEALVNVGDTNANEGEGEETTTPVSTPVAKIGNTGYATLDAAITAVQNGETIEVNAGEYTLNGSLNYTGKAFTIAAADGADVSFDMSAAVALHGAKITFNNVTFNYKTNGNYIGLQHTDTLVYNNCTINGMVFLYAVNETFNNCTFNQTSAGAYNVWTYGAQNVAFNGCTFNCVGRCVLVYNEGAIDKTDLTVENTKFNASAPAEGKAAIEIDTHLMKGGATITVDETTTDEGFAAGSNSGSTLWNDKKQTVGTNKNTTVTVAGETVFEPVATAAVAKIDETEYATLDEALKYLVGLEQENMQPTPKVYALSLLDGTKWDTATPVYWAAGTKSGFAAKLTDALTAAYKANAGKITIVCRPGADVGTMTHGHVADNITIFGNKAYVSGGECDLEVDTYKYNRETGANTGDGSDLNGDISIIAFQLDNLGVWGQRHTTHTVNVALVDCDSVKNIDVQRVYISGTSGKNMIGVTDCDFKTAATAVYSNADGVVAVSNCTFTGSKVPVNINHKANGTMSVDMQKCTFTNCGDAGDWKQFAAPVRFVNSGSGTMKTGVRETTFTGTVGTNGDILLGDGRTGKESNDVSLYVSDTDAKIQAQKPGYYNGNTTDANKKAATEVKSNETLDTSVETLLPAEPEQPVPDGYQEDASGNVTISDEAGLFWFAKQVNAGNNFAGKTVTLANNIALTKAWTPIGIYNDSKTHFKGTFDGQNHTVSGVEVTENRTKGVGFFGKVYTGTIKNLTVEGTITTTNCDYVGGIVGHGYATISNCTFKGNVGSTNTMQVGGIAGSGGFTITNCSVYGNVTAECWAGGIVGNCQDGGAYTNCYVEGVISAERTYWGGGAAGITPVPLYPSQVISSCYSNTVVKVAGKEVNCPIIAAYNNPLDYNGYTGDLKIYDNSWNKQKNSNDSYPIYAEKDGVGGVLVEGKVVSRDNNLVMLEDDLQYVTDLSKVRIMAGSAVTQAQVDALAVASIGTAKYISLAAAIAAANNGDTVTLLKDVTENVEIAATKKLTLDLNGCILNGGTGTEKAALTNYGTITIKDSSAAKTGTIKRDDNGTVGEKSYYVINNKGTMTIESGTVSNNSGYRKANSTGSMSGSSLICNGDDDALTPVLNIEGGKFAQENFIAIKNGLLGTLNVSGGEISSKHSAIQNWYKATITGGTINGQLWTDAFVWAEGTSIGETKIGGNAKFTGEIVMDITGTNVIPKLEITDGELNVTKWNITTAAANAGAKPAVSGGTFTSAVPEDYCAEGFIPTANADGTFGVKQGTYVAETKGVKYETLQAAIDAATRNQTVTMLANTEENVTIAKALTLDLNGFTLNGGTVAGKPALTVKARVTVKDSSEAQTGTIMREDTAENSGVSSHYVIDIQGRGVVMTFESGNVKNNSGNADRSKGASLVRVGDDSITDKKANPTLTINGGTFTQDNFIVIKVDRGYLNLNGGTLNSANTYAVENWFRATIKGGTVNGAVSSWTYSAGSNSTLTIEDGTVNGTVTSVNYGSAADKQARVYITGGTVNGKLDTRSYDPKTGELTSIVDAAKATIKVSGGTFNNAVEARYCDEGYTPVQISDGKYGVQQQQQVLAKIGDTAYYTMDEAFQAVKEGETITLLRDYTTGAEQYSGSKSFAIDLNGKTWTYTGTNTNHAAFEINHSDVTLTVKNGTVVSNSMVGLIPSAMGVGSTITYDNAGLVFEGVTMTANGHSGIETNGNNTNDTVTLKNSTLNVPNGFGIYFPSSGTLTIDNSTINAKTMGVQVCAGSLNISGDQTAITVTGDAVPKTENDGAIQDGAAISIVNRTGYKGLDKIEVTGGKFKSNGTNAAIKAYDWANNTESTFTANDKVAVSGGTFTSAVKEEYCAPGYIPTTNSDGTYGVKEGVYVAKVDNVKYETLQAAINAAKGGSTVRLLANVTLTETAVFPAGKKVDLNLVGHNITATGTALLINGTTDIQSTGGVGTIESTGNVAVAVGNNAKVTVYSGKLMGREGAVITGTSTGAKIEIRKNATLIATDNAVIAGNGSKRDGKPNTILVKGGTFIGGIVTTGYIACGIYAPWNDNVTVSGGTFNITNGAGIVARAGTVKVTGGTFNCGDGTAKGWVGDSKNNVPNAALVFDKAANYPALTESSQILVSGGTFSTDPAANGATLAAGYAAAKDESGMYKVAKENPAAEINGVKYDTLQAAINAAQATQGGATITLLKNINTESYYMVNGDNPVTIDLAGYNITGSGISGLFYVTAKGDLTIKGKGTVTAVEDNGTAMAVWVRSPIAKVTLEGGTYTQQISDTTDPHFDLIYVERGNVYVKGGTYEGFTPDWTLNCKDEHYPAEAKIEVTGGTFVGFDPANNTAEGEGTDFVPAGYVSTKGADGKFIVTEVKVAEVNGKQYGTLSEAIAAANAGDTVKLLRDINTPEISYMISKSLTIDLNGKTVTGDGYDAVFQINNADAKVLIKNGNIVAVENTGSAGKYAMAIWACKAECEVTLENLNVSQKITHTDDPQMDMIYASGGTIIINSGNFESGTPAWTLNCKDAAYKDGTANIIVKGGTFTGFDPANNKAEGENTNFVAAGYKSVDNGNGTYTVIVNEAVVAVIGDKEYETLAAATTDAKAGDTIVLVADAKGEQFVVIMSGVTLNLNGHSITGATMFYASGEVIDTSATKGVVSATSYSMNLENTYTSIYDKEKSGYSFFDLTIQSGVKNVEGDANAKAVQFRLKKDTNAALAERNRAFELLKKGVDSSRVEARVTVTWTDGDTTQHLIFVFTDDFMAQYCNPTQAKLFQVIFSGLDSIQANSIKAVASFVTYDGNNNVTHITHGKTETIK